MTNKLLFICLCISFNAFSNPFISFNHSLSSEIFIDAKRLNSYTDKMRLRPANFYERRTSGQAFYRPLTNTLVFRKNLLVKDLGVTRVRNSLEMIENNTNYFPSRSETIFHEISHGVLDIFIEEDQSDGLYYLVNKTLPAWFRANYGMFFTKTAVQELYGYSAGTIVALLYNDLQSIMLSHGLNYNTRGCMSEQFRRKVAKRLNFTQDNLSFKNILQNESYESKYLPQFIFINGKDIEINSSFKKVWVKQIFQNFQSKYGVPKDRKAFISKMNQSSFYQRWINRCFKDIL